MHEKPSIEYLYYVRALQVQKIREEATAKLIQPPRNSKPYKDLYVLLSIPRILLEAREKRKQLNEVFDSAREAVTELICQAALRRLLEELEYATGEKQEGSHDISFNVRIVVPESLTAAFSLRQEMLDAAISDGITQAMHAMLDLVEKDIPLALWRRDLIPKTINMRPALNGGAILFLETKIPQVYLRLYYERSRGEHGYPDVSLVIMPFEE